MNKPDYIAEKISKSITIDGNINKEVWKNAKWSKRFVDMVSGEAGMYNTQTALLWDNTHLYIAFSVEEPFVEANFTERDSLIFLENALEIFIDGGDCYYEFQVNALNTVYEVFFIWKDAYAKGSRFDTPQFDVHAIPWSSLELLANGRTLPPSQGDIWNIFLGRFQKLMHSGIETTPHPAMVLNSQGIYDTHLPEKWSRIEFEV